jgi:hypothetical protein
MVDPDPTVQPNRRKDLAENPAFLPPRGVVGELDPAASQQVGSLFALLRGRLSQDFVRRLFNDPGEGASLGEYRRGGG